VFGKIASTTRVAYPVSLPSFTTCSMRLSSIDPMPYSLISHSFDPTNFSPVSTTIFSNFQSISDLFYEVSKFQQHEQPLSRCRISLVPSTRSAMLDNYPQTFSVTDFMQLRLAFIFWVITYVQMSWQTAIL